MLIILVPLEEMLMSIDLVFPLFFVSLFLSFLLFWLSCFLWLSSFLHTYLFPTLFFFTVFIFYVSHSLCLSLFLFLS